MIGFGGGATSPMSRRSIAATPDAVANRTSEPRMAPAGVPIDAQTELARPCSSV